LTTFIIGYTFGSLINFIAAYNIYIAAKPSYASRILICIMTQYGPYAQDLGLLTWIAIKELHTWVILPKNDVGVGGFRAVGTLRHL